MSKAPTVCAFSIASGPSPAVVVRYPAYKILAAGPDITPITDLITTWIHIGQALVGSVGALAFIFALLCMP